MFDYYFLKPKFLIDTFLFTASSIARAFIATPFHYGQFNTFTVPNCASLIVWLYTLTTVLCVVIVVVVIAITHLITTTPPPYLSSTTTTSISQINTV